MTDVMRTVAEVSGARLGPDAGEDSVSFMPVLRDPAYEGPLHEAIVMHSDAGAFAIRQGRWKLLLAPGSGAASEKDSAGLPPVQLYDLESDPKEWEAVFAEFRKSDRERNVVTAKKLGVADPGAIIDDYERTIEKWRGKSKEIGRDIDKFTEVLNREIFSKIDLDKL